MKEWFANRTHAFWSLHIAGWAVYGANYYIGSVGRVAVRSELLAFTILAIETGFFLSLVLRLGLKRTWNWPVGPRITAWVAMLLCITLIDAFLLRWEMMSACPSCTLPSTWPDYIAFFGDDLLIYIAWAGCYVGIKLALQLQQEREDKLRAVAMAHEAQLRMLRYQLNPHFLFNTLNAISTLIFEGRRDEADEVVDALSRFLRYSLHSNPQQLVKLDQEVEALMLYLAIEHARFGPRLRFNCNVAPDARHLLVPNLILQPLVENAVKYAIAPREEGGNIEFSAAVDADALHIVLSDDGPGSDSYTATGAGRGIGVVNTRERLRVLYGKRQQFAIGRDTPGGTRVSIRIPVEHARGESFDVHTHAHR